MGHRMKTTQNCKDKKNYIERGEGEGCLLLPGKNKELSDETTEIAPNWLFVKLCTCTSAGEAGYKEKLRLERVD